MTRRKLLLLLLLLVSLASACLLILRPFRNPQPPAHPDNSPPLSREERAIRAIEALGGQVVKTSINLDNKPFVAVRLANIKTPLRPADLDALRDILFIRELDLSGSNLSDSALEGLTAMEPLAGLRKLHLPGTNVSDKGVAALGRLIYLAWLDLADTAVTGETLADPADAPPLAALRLAGTKLSNQSLRRLRNLKSLVSLDLSRTPLTDAAVPDLEALTGLRELWLEGTGMTPDALNRLEEALPNTKISR